jgi:thiol-disulfide isomerase/thioredoxin
MNKLIRNLAVAGTVLALAGAAAFSLRGNEVAPTVSYTLLDGSKHSTSELKGKVTLVNFWATSCTTCMKEMPELVETHKKYAPKGYETLSVAMKYDPPAYVANYASTRQLPFKVAIDNTGEIAKQFGDVQLTPTTFVVNKKGEIVKHYIGEPDFPQLHALIEKLLAES